MEKQQKVADTMTKLWADPAKAEVNGWQKYDPSKGNYLTFTADGAAMTEHQFAAVHHLDFWQKALQQTNKNTKNK